MQEGWSTNQRKLQEWLATPRYERIPPTQELFADGIGVNPVTISRWRKLPGFQEEVNSIAKKYLETDLPEIYGALGREAKKGNIQHIRTVLEMIGDIGNPGSVDSPFHLVVEYVNKRGSGDST